MSRKWQDFLGKEDYIKYCSESWWNIPWTIWIIPITLVIFRIRQLMKGGA